MKRTIFQRALCMIVCAAMLLAYLPGGLLSARATTVDVTTVADPETLDRPSAIYGDNTINAGKITVGKSVSNQAITINGKTIELGKDGNFLVSISQAAQVMGLASQSSLPVDVVFVLDTSGSMADNDRAGKLVAAANSAIATLMSSNEQNRVGVVAFSSAAQNWNGQWSDWGGGTANGAAANVLSSLQHYTGVAATNHIQWVNESGATSSSGSYIAGRDTVTTTTTEWQRVNGRWQQVEVTKTVNAYRNGKNGGTNIQAGIALGASLLTSVTDTTWTNPDNNQTVTRIPFLIVISDGQPTFVSSDADWYEPQGNDQKGPGSSAYEGNGFMAAMTAAYYKGKITEHYYGSKANTNDRCYIYTMGVELGALSGDDEALAQITLDPSTYATGNYAAANAKSYYRYGNSWDSDNRTTTNSFMTYWNNFQNGVEFSVRVDSNDSFTFTAGSIAAAKKYVGGVGYTGGLCYNDAYYAADNVSQMNSVFTSMVAAINKKAMSVPTKVTTGDQNFDGYIHVYDPLGEYMDVKDMKGILTDGYFYRGQSFAQKMAAYGTANADEAFDAQLRQVIKARMGLTSADDRFANEAELDAFIDHFLKAARDSGNQANYTDAEHYDNSLVWWGNAYNSGEEDEHMQLVGFAENDSVAYIQDQTAAGAIPAGADYVCRSYFFYGTAGGADPSMQYEYLYFIVRVQRELVAPYRQTVVISAPASLLSMEKVMINESVDSKGNTVYTANITHREPTRVIYEVGLWDGITPENVSMIVDGGYANRTVNGAGSVNYDPVNGVYNFFTNDWDRSEAPDSHHRAMAKATFDAAADNAFYTYQQDTLLVDADGNPVTGDPRGTKAYYVREYYAWNDGGKDGDYSATKNTKLIHVDIPTDAQLIQKDGKWYIPKGTYTGATLIANEGDTLKDDPSTAIPGDGNLTGTSEIVAHPHRTGDSTNSHYTVLLGNNGKLTMVSRPYAPSKDVSITGADGTTITDGNGKPVQVGDVLTYTIQVKNVLTEAADILVTDYVPGGTAFVAGSAMVDGVADAAMVPDSNNVLTWNLKDVPAGQSCTVSFRVTVLPSALNMNVVAGTLQNTAHVTIGNNPAISTNPTYNPPYGKTVTDANGAQIDGQTGNKVGDILVFHIRVTNTAVDENGNFTVADVTVTDAIPNGTVYVEGSADNGGVLENGVLTWKFENMGPGAAKVVSFKVRITAEAKADQSVQPEDGQIEIQNAAAIRVENAPVIITNTTVSKVELGDLVISKTVAAGGDTTKVFIINLQETGNSLNGTYVLYRGATRETVTFVNGKASVSIKHGDVLTIKGLPVGAILTVAEDTSSLPGWTPSYNTGSVTIVDGAATTVASVSVTNNYTLQPLTLTLKGVKKMSGAALTAPVTFGFLAVPDSNNPEVGDPLSGEVTVDGNGDFAFSMSSKTFTKPGVYKYTITEIDGGVAGIHYDGSKHVLQINVLDNGDGTMRAEATLNGAAFDMAGSAVTFSNQYVPEKAVVSFAAEKVLEGRVLKTGEFTFRLTDGTNTYYGTNDQNGLIHFEALHFTQEGTYTFTMSEVVPASKAQSMTYDTAVHTLVVKVTDQGGKLVAVVTDGSGNGLSANGGVVDTGITFTNVFTPADAPLRIIAKKILLGYNEQQGRHEATAPAAGAFHFQITDENGKILATGINDANGLIQFETVMLSAELVNDGALDAAGNRSKTFRWTISEVKPLLDPDPNMKYDLTGRTVDVTLTHKADGTLVVSVGGDNDGNVDLSNGVIFTNYANPGFVTVTPQATKVITGGTLPAGLSFSFVVRETGDASKVLSTGFSAATAGGGSRETVAIGFSSVTFDVNVLEGQDQRTFRYWIEESNAGAEYNGVTYDKTRYLYVVQLNRDVVTGQVTTEEFYFKLRNGGNAEDPEDYTDAITAAEVVFTNTYEAKTHINLTAGKELTGHPQGLQAGMFEFQLQRLDPTGKLVAGSRITGTNDADGVVRFGTLNYTDAMLTSAYMHSDGAYYFSYLMEEIEAVLRVPGVTYDRTRYIVTIKITNTNGDLTATLANVSEATFDGTTYMPKQQLDGFTAQGNTNATFVNRYQAVQGDVVRYKITKILEGRTLRAGEFEFGLFLNGQLVATASNDANGIVIFEREIPATAASHAGWYEMVIRELGGNVPGVTYSTQEYKVYVRVEDNGQGAIVATVHESQNSPALEEDAQGYVDLTDKFVFTNTYKAADTDFVIEAAKQLKGRALLEGEFAFLTQLIRVNGTAVTDGTVYHGANDAQGNVLFQRITFTEAGTYLYKLTEVKGTAPGMLYDERSYYLQVEVTDDCQGQLIASGAYFADEDCTQTVQNVTFVNLYTPASVAVELQGHKTLEGRPMADKEFTFLVYREGDLVHPVASGSNDAAGNIVFSTFNITAADMLGENGEFVASRSFRYIIRESDNRHPGVVYAEDVTVTVTVTNNNGVFTAKVTYPQGDQASFRNVYTPAGVSVPLKAYKTLQGKAMEEFTFELKAEDGTVKTLTNDENGIILIDALQFTAADLVDAQGNKVMEKTFIYTLTEKAGTKEGMVYDDAVYTITVTVTDDGQGQLTATKVYTLNGQTAQVLQFANTYTPPAIELELEGLKTIVDAEGNVLTGDRYPLSGFTFLVFDADGRLLTETVSDGAGKIRFDGFKFAEAGEYRFTVLEKNTTKAGYTTDANIWCVHITVGYDAETGLLYKAGTYIHIGPESHDGIAPQSSKDLEFVNVYDPADVHLVLKGLKNLEGRPLREHEFTFYMVDEATGLRAADSRNHGNGEIHFALTYNKAGTYTYTVYEEIPGDPSLLQGVQYSTQTHKVTVTVTDDGTGALKAKVEDITILGSGDVDLTGSMIFTNIYSPASASVTVEAWKTLEGKALEAGKYSFRLVNTEDASESYTATNQVDGRITFQGLQFSDKDLVDAQGNKVMEKTFTYQLSEVVGQEPGVTYDRQVYTVLVTVTDDGYGQLHVAVRYENSKGESVLLPEFVNVYEAKPVSYTPEVGKIFEGGAMLNFNFVLSGEGFDTQVKQNNAEGKVHFDQLTFTEAGKYTFTIAEKIDETLEDIKWDTNVYTVTIEVIDPGKGELVIRDITITSENGSDDLIFRNVHKDVIVQKDAFLQGKEEISIDGHPVQVGDVMGYVIRYKNYTGKPADVTIIDKIPAYTKYVEGSADQGAVLENDTLTWKFANVAPGATVTVTFLVEVTGSNATITNEAKVIEGENTYVTNTVGVPVPEDEMEKDVFLAAQPDVSLDGQVVKVGDKLIYTITYRNSYEAAADVTITDRIPQHTKYVEGSADNGAVFANGLLTWQVHLEAGESITVSFQVEVTGNNALITNQATALEGTNSYKTNTVTVTTPVENPKTGDDLQLTTLLTMMGISALGIVLMLTVIPGGRKKEEF